MNDRVDQTRIDPVVEDCAFEISEISMPITRDWRAGFPAGFGEPALWSCGSIEVEAATGVFAGLSNGSGDTGAMVNSHANRPAAAPGPGRCLNRFDGIFILAVLVATAFFARQVVQYFGGPLIGMGSDDNLWGYYGYYVYENLWFCPLPQLDLVNDTTLYPYGTFHA